MTDHPWIVRLGRLASPDARDHSMRALLAPAAGPVARYRYWREGPILDQGQTPQCTAYAWTGWEMSSPTRDKALNIDSPEVLYNAEQAIDEWAGTPHDGSSVRAGAKVMQAEGRLGEYVFATDIATVRDWLLRNGPVVFGTNWTEKMFNPDADHVVHPTGMVVGGHAYLVTGYSAVRGAFKCRNSWGPLWGTKGNFWINEEDAAALLRADGEACAAIEIPRV